MFGSEGLLKKKDLTVSTDSQLEAGTSALPEPEFTQEQDGFFERTFGKSGITDLVDDTFVNIRQGIAQGASLNEALKLQRKGSRATKQDIQQYADAVGRMQSIPITDEMMDFQKIYEENDKSWLGFIKGISKNPSVLSGVIAQSMASMVNPTVAFGAVKGAGAGLAAGAAAGAALGPGSAITALGGAQLGAVAGLTNTLEGGLAFTEFLQEEIEKKGLEFNDESIAAILNDDEAFRKVKSRTKARGYSIALVNTITAGVASQLARSGRNIKRLGDLKVGGVTLPTSRVLPGPQTAIRSGTEFVGGGLGEVVGRTAAGQEMDVAEIGFEAFGELGSPEAIIPSFRNATYEIDGERVTKIDVIDIINGQPDNKEDNTEYIEILNNITIKNDIGLQNEKDKLYKKETTKNEVLKGLTEEQKQGITDKQIESLVNETIELKNYESSNTPPGNENAAKTREKIKQITDAIQEPSTETIPVSQQPKTSPAVGTGDTQGAITTGEIASEETQTTQPTEEVTTEVETQESQVTPPLAIRIEPGTQTEQVTQLLEQRGELTISEAANELGILEPNVRRIFGVGAKEGKFERVGKGVYTLTQGDKTYAVIEGNALIEMPKLIEQGIKFDAIYLDPPYEVKSGNRDIAQFSVINPAEFAQLSNLMPQLLKNEDSPVLLQYTQAQQPQNKKERASYLRSLSKAGLNLAADIQKIEYIKMTQDMKKEQKMAGRNLREDIFVLTKSGKVKDIPFNLKQEGENFELRYPMVDTRTKKFKGFKGDTRKSLEALADLIEGFVPEGGIILDPFLGTGTTVEAAIETGREAVGIELDPAKAEKARKQIEKKTQKIKSTQTKSDPKKVKQTVPADPTEPGPKPGLSPELQESINKMIPAIDRITLNGIRFGLDNIASQVKVLATRRNNVLLQKARSTPTQYIDQSLGVNNSTVIADNTFTTLAEAQACLLYTSPSPRDRQKSRMPSSA